MNDSTFAYMWEFRVRIDSDAEFRRHYGPGGTWALLFRKAPGYIETRLYRDARENDRYVTVDRWQSLDAYRKFRVDFAREYEQLDRRCRGMTTSETHIGSFNAVMEAHVDPSFGFKRRRSDR